MTLRAQFELDRAARRFEEVRECRRRDRKRGWQTAPIARLFTTTNEVEMNDELAARHTIMKALQAQGRRPEEFFRDIDENEDNHLSRDELRKGLGKGTGRHVDAAGRPIAYLDVPMNEGMFRALWNQLDTDKDGKVTMAEWCALLRIDLEARDRLLYDAEAEEDDDVGDGRGRVYSVTSASHSDLDGGVSSSTSSPALTPGGSYGGFRRGAARLARRADDRAAAPTPPPASRLPEGGAGPDPRLARGGRHRQAVERRGHQLAPRVSLYAPKLKIPLARNVVKICVGHLRLRHLRQELEPLEAGDCDVDPDRRRDGRDVW